MKTNAENGIRTQEFGLLKAATGGHNFDSQKVENDKKVTR